MNSPSSSTLISFFSSSSSPSQQHEREGQQQQQGHPPAALDRLSSLPQDILIQIGLTVPNREFGRLLQTNREIHEVLDTRWVWHRRFVDRIGLGYLKYRILHEAGRQRYEMEIQKPKQEQSEDDHKKKDGDDGDEVGSKEGEDKAETAAEAKRRKAAVMEEIMMREKTLTMLEVKSESCQFSKRQLLQWFSLHEKMRVDVAEMWTKFQGGEHFGKYYWATFYGVQPGHKYWVQWGVSIKNRYASFEGDYRVWTSDKHQMATSNPKRSEATPMLVYRPQDEILNNLRQAGNQRTLHSPLPRTLTEIEIKNNYMIKCAKFDLSDEKYGNTFNDRLPSTQGTSILQLPRPFIIPLQSSGGEGNGDGDGDGDKKTRYENERTTVTVMARLPLASARAGIGLVIEYAQLVPAGRGDPRAVEVEEEETEGGEDTVEQQEEQLVDMDDWVDGSWYDKDSPVRMSRLHELNDLVRKLCG